MRLAEILGSLHYLRTLCGEAGGRWRTEMEGLLEAENPDTERRAKLIARFNHGTGRSTARIRAAPTRPRRPSGAI